MELSHATLDRIPSRPSGRGSALGAHLVVDACLERGKRVLDVGALVEAGAQEGRVQSQEDPASALEENGGEEEADPEEDLENSNDRHGSVVVLLDKVTNDVGDRVVVDLGLCAGRSTGRRSHRRGGDNGRDDGGAGVGRKVEDGVDTVGEHGNGVLGRKEPDEGHH